MTRSESSEIGSKQTYPSGTVTSLFPDVEGSTRRWEADQRAMLAAVERHFALLDAANEANNGVRFKTIGDSIQAAFPTALDGALAAVNGQRALADEDWGAIDAMPVRMALHTGAATPREGDYLAPSLNRLARLLATGAGGQILVSEAARNLLRDALPPGIELRDLGEHRLRDLKESEHVYQLVAPGLPTDFPPIRSLTRPTTNLPAQLTSFVGRAREVAEIKHRLADRDVRLLTLIGPGGTGKTRLAVRAASDLIDDYADGVWFVALAAISSPSLVASTIAEALGVRETADQPIDSSLCAFLQAKHLLLILDNFEHLLGEAPLVANLLAASPGLQILATSRAPLRISGEQEMQIAPLTLPEDADSDVLASARESEAVRLFVERAQAVRAGFTLDERNAGTIVAICRRLDGLPLAIELAAARIRLLSLDAILERLDSRLTLLTGGGRDRPERQQTLRAAIAWSHDMLAAEEQVLFRRLAVFAGDWTLEAAEAVAAAATPPVSVLDALDSLVSNSLIQQCEAAALNGREEARFTLLQTIQEFAIEELEASGEGATIRDAHAAFYLNLARAAQPELSGPSALAWLTRLDADHGNLRAALAWLCQGGQSEQALQMAAALWRFWVLRGHIVEGRSQLEAVLALDPANSDATMRAEVLDAAGTFAEMQGDYQRAEDLHQQALDLARNLDDQYAMARALGNLGVVAFDRGEIDQARTLLQQSLAQAEAGANQELVATALNDLGRIAFYQGELEAAEDLYRRSVDLWRQSGSASKVALALNNLGLVVFNRGDYRQARRLFEESLSLSRTAGDRWVMAAPLNALALAVRREGDLPRAIALTEESLALFREAGDTRNAAVALLNLAGVTRESGDHARAVAAIQEALRGFRAVDDRAGIIESLAGIGRNLVATGGYTEAARLLGAVESISGEPPGAYPLSEGEQYAADVEATKAALGQEAFAKAWREGTSLSLDDAIAAAAAVSLPDPSEA